MQWSEDIVPTVAFNFRKVRKGAVTFKIWDVAGQPKFRSMWERYCHGMDAVMCVSFLLSSLRSCSEVCSADTRVKICRGFCRYMSVSLQ